MLLHQLTDLQLFIFLFINNLAFLLLGYAIRQAGIIRKNNETIRNQHAEDYKNWLANDYDASTKREQKPLYRQYHAVTETEFKNKIQELRAENAKPLFFQNNFYKNPNDNENI